MELSRREFLASAAVGVIAASLSGAATATSVPAADFSVQLTRESFGDGYFGNVMGAFARGHHNPQDVARKVIGELYCDGAIDDVFRPDMVNADGELIDEQAAIDYLTPKARHIHVRLIDHDYDGEPLEGGGWILDERVGPGAAGAFPATVFDL